MTPIPKDCPFCGELHLVVVTAPVVDYDEQGHPIVGPSRFMVVLECAPEPPPYIPLELWQKREKPSMK